MTTTAAAPPTALAPQPDARLSNVRTLLQRAEDSLKTALPQGIPVSYMMRVVLTAVQRNPDLLECDPITLLGAVFQAAQLGLVPDGVLGQAYLVPFFNTKKNRKEVQFIPGYRGLVTLVRRSGELSTIDAEVVHQKDKFSYQRGTDPQITHEPYQGQDDPGPIVAVWAIAKLKDGGFQIVVLTTREVEKIKARSASVKAKRASPWDTDPGWMFKKTALKQLCKLLPVSVETQRALALDDRAEVNLPQDLALLASESETPTPIDDDDAIDTPAEIRMPERKVEAGRTGEVRGGENVPGEQPPPRQPEAIPEPPEPKAPAPPANALYIVDAQKIETQSTRGKTDEQTGGLVRKFFVVIKDSKGNLHFTFNQVDAVLAQALRYRDGKTPVDIVSAKSDPAEQMAELTELVAAS